MAHGRHYLDFETVFVKLVNNSLVVIIGGQTVVPQQKVVKGDGKEWVVDPVIQQELFSFVERIAAISTIRSKNRRWTSRESIYTEGVRCHFFN
jgi:hypothetical protein